MAACGVYVCDKGSKVYNGKYYYSATPCDSQVSCHNGGLDEKFCEEKVEAFGCMNFGGKTYKNMGKPQVCDRKCDCDLFCEHKCQCGGYNYHYWHTCSNTRNIILSRFLCNKDIGCPQVEDDGNCEATCTWEANFMLNYKLANLIPDVHRARISKGLSIPGPVNKKCYVLLALPFYLY